jgi:serine protease Do
MLLRLLLIIFLISPAPSFAGGFPTSARQTVAPVVRAVTPGVVNISTRKVEAVEIPADPLLQQFLDAPGGQMRRETASAGSGVIVDAEQGYILTNEHVVRGASVIEVTTRDDRRFRARLIGRDRATDLAVLKIDADNLTAVPLGDDSALEVGDFVLAIGNSFGLGQTVTSGIVSALGRSGVGTGGYEDFIQTDATINPGNSGGALVTLDGRLIGVNTAILSKSGASNGIGFAIPVSMARAVMQQLVQNGEVSHGRIGLGLKNSPARDAAGETVVEIASVEPSSTAAAAGLQKGDIILSVDGKKIASAAQLRSLVGVTPVGRELGVRYRRGETTAVASVQIARAAAEPSRRKAP